MSELSGIELREAVAREVFGVSSAWQLADNGGEWCFYNGGDFQRLPAYESDIAAAFTVLDKIINDHNGTLTVSIDMLFPNSGDTPDITVSFRDFWESGPVMGHGASTQEAICRAALSAVRASTKEAK